MHLDTHLSHGKVDDGRTQPPLRVTVEWAPAYELWLSIEAYLNAKRHVLAELGPLWVRSVPAEAAAPFTRKAVVHQLKGDCDLMPQLIHACPDRSDVAAFLDWF